MDVDAVLLSVQERDKWRRRLDVLERSLEDVRASRASLQERLRRVRRELSALSRYSDALLDVTSRRPAARSVHASEGLPPHR